MIDDARIGRILVETGKISEADLQRVIEQQRKSSPPKTLSELLVSCGYLSSSDLQKISDHADQYQSTAVVAPRTIGKFRIDAEVGRGGMGVVYRAWQSDLERVVALKMLPSTADGALKERFLREARTASRLRHPNIVAVHEMGEVDGSAFFTMDYVKGDSFDGALKRGGIGKEENLGTLVSVARALDYAHREGVVHRDIKPHNILVDERGTAFLTDFGLAREIRGQSSLTVSGQILGTPAFMSPEQARGGRAEIGPASDIYSLGAVLYVVLTGRPPFTADAVYDLLDSIIRIPPAPPRSRNPEVSPALEAVCLMSLEKDPARRYASAGAFAADLERAISGRAVEAPAPKTKLETGRRRPGRSRGGTSRRRPLAVVLSTVGALVLMGVIIVPMMRSVPEVRPARSMAERSTEQPAVATVNRQKEERAPAKKAVDDTRTYAFSDPLDLLDWRVMAGGSRGEKPVDVRLDGAAMRLRNVEVRLAAPLDGAQRMSATVKVAEQGHPLYGIRLGGYRFVRNNQFAVVMAPSGREIGGSTTRSLLEGESEELTFEVGGGRVSARVGSKVVHEESLPEPVRPLRPGFFAHQDTAIACSNVAVTGRIREGWAEGDERDQVGRGYALGTPVDLLAGGPLGRFSRKEAGTWKRTGDTLQGTAGAGERAELHARTDFLHSRFRFKYRVASGLGLDLRVRAGYREVMFYKLPPRSDGGWRSVEIISLDDSCDLRIDGNVRFESMDANGTDVDGPLLRLSMREGVVSIKDVVIEELKGVATRGPWTLVFSDGAAHGLAPGGWEIAAPWLKPTGEVRTRDSWRNVETEVTLHGPAGVTVDFGFRGNWIFQAGPFPTEDAYGYRMRVEGTEASLGSEEEFRRVQIPDGEGPLQIRVRGGAEIDSIRVRPLR